MDWDKLEEQVRKIAETHWNSPCKPRVLHGVKCDGVIEITSDHWIAIEISKENSLSKLRTDLAKFSVMRIAQFTENILTQCYFITSQDTSSLKESGRSNKVEVLSIEEFSAKFIGKEQYKFVRNQRQFGSAVDPDTGDADTSKYAKVSYISDETGKAITVGEIADQLNDPVKIVLLGEFGSGKSRCVKELFEILSNSTSLFPVLAINLRECWGLRSFDLIIRSHLESLGLSQFSDNVVKLSTTGKVTFLLDGFDEIGSQSWTGEVERLREIRRKSLTGVYDLINKCKSSSIFICGREHYFSSDEEMISCLGLDPSVRIMRCPTEFSDEELKEYLLANTQLHSVPSWMPRKPLVCQLFSKLSPNELHEVTETSSNEVDFFEKFLDAICKREKAIHPAIDQLTLKGVLLALAEETREKSGDVEEISPNEINQVFYQVSGLTPLDESAIMLQRLPYLGRVGSGNPNRTFIDNYAKSGLKALSLCNHIYMTNKTIANKRWIKPAGEFGNRILKERISNWGAAFKYAKYCMQHGNNQVISDVVCGNLSCDAIEIDFGGVEIQGSNFDVLDFSHKSISNLAISNCFSLETRISDAKFSKCRFDELIGSRIDGVAAKSKLPDAFLKSCDFDQYTNLDNVSRISELPLSDAQKTLIVIIKKLFFQKGRGRKENALLRGLEDYWDDKTAEKFIRYGLKNGIIVEGRGDEGKLYIPQRRHTKRMARIIETMTNSDDELWKML